MTSKVHRGFGWSESGDNVSKKSED